MLLLGSHQAFTQCLAGKRPSWFASWWMRKGPDGTLQPIPSWEKMYWYLGLGGVALLVLPRAYVYMKTSKSREEKEKEEQVRYNGSAQLKWQPI